MNTSVLPDVDFVTENGRTGILSQIDFVGNEWRGHGNVLAGDDGLAYVNVLNGADKAGNVMLAALNITNFLIDTLAPTNLSVQINGGNAYSASHNVTLAINAEDVLAIEMMIANDAGFSGASWESYSASKSWTLASGDGSRSAGSRPRNRRPPWPRYSSIDLGAASPPAVSAECWKSISKSPALTNARLPIPCATVLPLTC
jgi:hypothetical protein